MSNFNNFNNFKGTSWADMEDSDDDIETSVVSITINKEVKEISNNFIFDDINHLILKAQTENFQKEIYNLVIARIKNFSHIGINKMEKSLKNFDNLKVEFYYTRRDMKINKIYKTKSLEEFSNVYNNLTKKINENGVDKLNVINKDLLQYYINDGKYIYIPFFKVDGKYFDLIKYLSTDKSYSIVLYPIQL